MADTKLSQLLETLVLTDEDQFYTNDSGTSKRITWANVRAEMRAGLDADETTSVVNKTQVDSPVTLLSTESLTTFTNDAAVGEVVFNLPAAVVGLSFSFAKTALAVVGKMTLTPDGTDYIGEGAAGDSIEIKAVGARVTLRCYLVGQWAVEHETQQLPDVRAVSSGNTTIAKEYGFGREYFLHTSPGYVTLPLMSSWAERKITIANLSAVNVAVNRQGADIILPSGIGVELRPGAAITLYHDSGSNWRLIWLAYGALPSVPTTGWNGLGTICWNSAPTTGEALGWICTGTGSPGTWIDLPRLGTVIAAKTEGDTPVTVTSADSGTTFTNEGATALVEFDLPAAVAGLNFTFARVADQIINIDPNGTDVIGTGAAGAIFPLNTDNRQVTLTAYQAGEWVIARDAEDNTAATIAKTTNDTLSAGLKNQSFSNEGATGTITLTLPIAVVGDSFEFIRIASESLRIKPSSSEYIGNGGQDNYLETLSDNSKVILKCHSANNWAVESATGDTQYEGLRVVVKTQADSPVTLTVDDISTTYVNTGASDTTEFDLPVSVAGMSYKFIRTAGQIIRLDPNGTEVIADGTAGYYLDLITTGAVCELKCYVAGSWVVENETGISVFET